MLMNIRFKIPGISFLKNISRSPRLRPFAQTTTWKRWKHPGGMRFRRYSKKLVLVRAPFERYSLTAFLEELNLISRAQFRQKAERVKFEDARFKILLHYLQAEPPLFEEKISLFLIRCMFLISQIASFDLCGLPLQPSRLIKLTPSYNSVFSVH